MSSVGDQADQESLSDADDRDAGSSNIADWNEGSYQNRQSDLDAEEREGRFYGPDVSWRTYTRDERALAASLEQADANDLSLHLYNAHAWKARLYNTDCSTNARPWHSKRRWIGPDEHGQEPFIPHLQWTAWPLRPIDVPRREVWGIPTVYPDDDPSSGTKSERWKPSTGLQEEIQALILRKARERFQERDCARERIKRKSTDMAISHFDSKPRPTSRDNAINPSTPDDCLSDINSNSSGPADKPPNAMRAQQELEPVFLADDEAAATLTQYPVRHILAKLDDLLVGLHKSRLDHRSTYTDRPGSRSRSRSRTRSESREQSLSHKSSKRKRIASDATVEGKNLAEASRIVVTAFDPKSLSQSIASQQKPLNLRDWSEVLGIASLLGWDQRIIKRAAKRCASLFREGVEVRAMPETSSGRCKDRTFLYTSCETTVPSIETDSSASESDEGILESEIGPYICPYETCTRHDFPYEKLWRLNEHLKRKHHHTNDEIDSKPLEMWQIPQRPERSDGGDEGDAYMRSGEAQARNGNATPLFLEPITVDIPSRSARKRSRVRESKIAASDEDSR